MNAVLFASSADNPAAWRAAIESRLPGVDFRVWPETGDPADIDAAIVWRYRPGILQAFPNLRLICSLGAGVDHILGDPDLPEGVPFCRIVDPDLTAGMSEYVVLAVLRYHRQLPEYEASQRARQWRKLRRPDTRTRRIGILGMGVLGQDAATKLRLFGFPVAGWSRRPKAVDGVEMFAGDEGLTPFLARSDMLVCLLPLTPATTGIIGARLLASLPPGAFVINAARGGHVVDADLLAALDSGHVAGATLDVFVPEPLPAEHPYWTHPKVTITPHVASLTNPETAADQIAENIRRRRSGQPLLNQVDRKAGY